MREVFTNILATGQGEMLGFLHPRLFLIKKGFRAYSTGACKQLCTT
jgi:hypothetical protein